MNKKIFSRIVVGGMVLCNRKVLILKRHGNERMYPGLWELPSGKVEVGESLEQALMREVKEETGLAVNAQKMISEFNYYVETPEGSKETVQINFLAIALTKNVTISKEHESFAWIDQSELTRYNISAQTKEVIQKGFNVHENLADGRLTHQT